MQIMSTRGPIQAQLEQQQHQDKEGFQLQQVLSSSGQFGYFYCRGSMLVTGMPSFVGHIMRAVLTWCTASSL
jgi:hypothetical protein